MTIDPISQFSLLFAAFIGGIALGALADFGKVLKILLGAHQPPSALRTLYERPLPLLKKALGWRVAPARRAWRMAVSLCADLLFPIIASLVFLWIGFRFHSGTFRFSALLLLVIGVALWRALVTPHLAPPVARAAFLLAAGLLYLRTALFLPVQLVWKAVYRFCLLPMARLRCMLLRVWHAHGSRLLCEAQLHAAENGFAAPPRVGRLNVGKGIKRICRKKGKKAAASLR